MTCVKIPLTSQQDLTDFVSIKKQQRMFSLGGESSTLQTLPWSSAAAPTRPTSWLLPLNPGRVLSVGPISYTFIPNRHIHCMTSVWGECLGGPEWANNSHQSTIHHPLEALLWLSCGRRISVSYITGVFSSFGSHLVCFSIISFIEPSLVSTLISSLFFVFLSLAKPAILFVGKVGSFEEVLSSWIFCC